MAKKPAKTKAVTVHPKVTLRSRRGDVDLSPEELAELELFSQLAGKPPDFASYPGSVVLRRYQRGETICRQGDAGATAFYVLTESDVAAIRRLSRQQYQQAQDALAALPDELAAARQTMEQAQAELDARQAAADGANRVIAEDSGAGENAAELQKTAKLAAAQVKKQEAVVKQAAESVSEIERSAEKLPARIEWLRENAAALAAAESGNAAPGEAPLDVEAGARQIASVVLSTRRGANRSTSGLRNVFKSAPKEIQVDAPTPVDAASGVAPIFAGELFGEMSCIMHTPRSATIVADVDCYMLEFLRSILDHVRKDSGFKARMEPIYRRRVLKTDLKRLDIFRDFGEKTEAGLELLQQHAELCSFSPGQVICDEGDPSDAVYLVRSGVVQIVQELSLGAGDFAQWTDLCRELVDAAGDGELPNGVTPAVAGRRAVWSRLSDDLHAGITRLASADSSAPDDQLDAVRAALRDAFNGLIRDREFLASPEMRPVLQRDDIYVGAHNELRNRGEWTPPGQLLAVRNNDYDKKTSQRVGAVFLQEKLAGRLKERLAGQSEEEIKQHMLRDDGPALRAEIAEKELTENLKKTWTDHQVRVVGRLALEYIFAGRLHGLRPLNVINYLSRGDIFGEIGVLQNRPRTATCIAYDNRGAASRPAATEADLVRISKEVFDQLKQMSPGFEQAVIEVESQRMARDAQQARPAPGAGDAPITSLPDFDDLVQGRRLLLIDLDRCTRCGDCVQACINTHGDGFTRLYLDGPRFDRFLIPSACRQCRDPACLIGCPVGSIQRGASGEIQIHDWCIGCSLCAQQCPYDAIQMQDIGVIPEWTPGWRFLPARALAPRGEANDRWTRGGALTGYRDGDWAVGAAPFEWDLDFVEQLQRAETHKSKAGLDDDGRVYFRYRFSMSGGQCGRDNHYKLSLTSQGAGVELWLNGAAVEMQQAGRSGNYDARLAGNQFKRGANMLAVSIKLPVKPGDTVLSARLDAVSELNLAAFSEGRAEAKQVADRAVVCDLCSSLPSGQPACVNMCPHDAAFRIDALTELGPLLANSRQPTS